jgi:hypothetical protein
LSLTVPATVGVELVVPGEEGVASTALGKGSLGDDGLVLLPDLSLNVEGVDVRVGNASVVKTTVATVDPELALVVAAAGVGTGRGSTDGGFLVFLDGLVAEGAGPGQVGDLEPPGVVEAAGRGGVAAEDEDAVTLLGGASDVLGTGGGKFITVALLLFPTAFLGIELHGVDVTTRHNFLIFFGRFDTTVHNVANLATDVR